MELMCDDEKVVPALKSLQDVIDELHRVFDEDTVDVDYVKILLECYISRPKDWKKYVSFDADRYTKHLVDEGNGKFDLLILCWGEGHGSAIHDHGGSHCFVKILAGQLKETIYDWPSTSPSSPSPSEPGQPMLEKDVVNHTKDQVTYINDSMGLHMMENPSQSDRAVTLHLYSPPLGACNLFDVSTGHRRTAHMTSWSRNEKLERSDPSIHECTM